MDAAAGALDDDSLARLPRGWPRRMLSAVRWISFAAAALGLFQLLLIELPSFIDDLKHGSKEGIDLTLATTVPSSPWRGTTEYAGTAYAEKGSVWYTEAHARVVGAPTHAIVLMHLGSMLTLVTVLALLCCVELLARRLLAGDGFDRRAVRLVVVLAFVIMVGFTASSLLTQIGHLAIGKVAYNPASGEIIDLLAQSGITFSFTPLYPGLALLGLAAIFTIGERLQRETEGLV